MARNVIGITVEVTDKATRALEGLNTSVTNFAKRSAREVESMATKMSSQFSRMASEYRALQALKIGDSSLNEHLTKAKDTAHQLGEKLFRIKGLFNLASDDKDSGFRKLADDLASVAAKVEVLLTLKDSISLGREAIKTVAGMAPVIASAGATLVAGAAALGGAAATIVTLNALPSTDQKAVAEALKKDFDQSTAGFFYKKKMAEIGLDERGNILKRQNKFTSTKLQEQGMVIESDENSPEMIAMREAEATEKENKRQEAEAAERERRKKEREDSKAYFEGSAGGVAEYGKSLYEQADEFFNEDQIRKQNEAIAAAKKARDEAFESAITKERRSAAIDRRTLEFKIKAAEETAAAQERADQRVYASASKTIGGLKDAWDLYHQRRSEGIEVITDDEIATLESLKEATEQTAQDMASNMESFLGGFVDSIRETKSATEALKASFKSLVDEAIKQLIRLIAIKFARAILDYILPGVGTAAETGVNAATGIASAASGLAPTSTGASALSGQTVTQNFMAFTTSRSQLRRLQRDTLEPERRRLLRNGAIKV